MKYSLPSSVTPVRGCSDASTYFIEARKYYNNYYGEKSRKGKVRIIIELDLDDLMNSDEEEHQPIYPYAPTYPYWETNPYIISC